MRLSRRVRALGRMAALPLLVLAVLLQLDAVATSTVMNLAGTGPGSAMAATMPMCGAGMGSRAAQDRMSPSHGGDHRPDPAHAPRTLCGYCAAAAHAPTLALAEPLWPSCTIAFAAFRTLAVLGPRGPPPVPPRARGPPLSA